MLFSKGSTSETSEHVPHGVCTLTTLMSFSNTLWAKQILKVITQSFMKIIFACNRNQITDAIIGCNVSPLILHFFIHSCSLHTFLLNNLSPSFSFMAMKVSD